MDKGRREKSRLELRRRTWTDSGGTILPVSVQFTSLELAGNSSEWHLERFIRDKDSWIWLSKKGFCKGS